MALHTQRALSNVFSNSEQTQVLEVLGGTNTETILKAFKVLNLDGRGSIHKEYIKGLLMSQANKMTANEETQMLEFAFIDVARNLDVQEAV